ncbi:MAG: lectin-like protein [Victivallaceae bacterium]|jgi:hypothetical protein
MQNASCKSCPSLLKLFLVPAFLACLACLAWPLGCYAADPVKSVWAGDRYFELVPWSGTWDAAKFDAESKGGRLACIKDAETNNIIFDDLTKSSDIHMIYFGGCRINGIWNWVDGSTMQYKNWHPGQPNHPTSNAVVFQPKKNTWNNVPTNHVYKSSAYILELTREQYNALHPSN